MRRAVLLLLAAAAPAVAGADVNVRVNAGKLDVTARAPLSEVLDRIAKQTGMKVVYDGAPPRQLVATELHAVTPARAIQSLLEGQNVNFAASMDRSGEHVTMLMILGTGAKPGVSPAAPAPRLPEPVVSTGYDESDAQLNGEGEMDPGMMEEAVPEDVVEPELEVDPAMDPTKQGQPDAEAVPQPVPGPGVFPAGNGQLGVFSPFPAAPAAGAGAGAGAEMEKPIEDPEAQDQ